MGPEATRGGDSVEALADRGLRHAGAERGHPAGDLAGDVAVGQANVGQHLTALCLSEELLRQPDVTARHIDLGPTQRR